MHHLFGFGWVSGGSADETVDAVDVDGGDDCDKKTLEGRDEEFDGIYENEEEPIDAVRSADEIDGKAAVGTDDHNDVEDLQIDGLPKDEHDLETDEAREINDTLDLEEDMEEKEGANHPIVHETKGRVEEVNHDVSSLGGERENDCSTEAQQPDVAVELDENGCRDDSYPKARDFLVDADGDDGITLANQAAEIVQGFNDGSDGDKHHDDRTITTHRTSGTRVQPVSAVFRLTLAQKDEAEQSTYHPHQSIFDILDRNFEELGDGSSRDGRKFGYKDVKLCFVAFVSVFSLPSEPVSVNWNLYLNGEDPSIQRMVSSDGSGKLSNDTNGEMKPPRHDDQNESTRQRVPLSVAFALWNKVLQQSHDYCGREISNDHLSYIRSTLVLLGMLDLASIERGRDDGVENFLSQPFGNSNRSIECLVVHDSIHQQYGEYLAWGEHEGAYKPLVEACVRQWNEAALTESKQIGSNQFTLRMMPLNTMRAGHLQDAFDLLNDKHYVRRRMRVLRASGAARAHIGDVDELLHSIEKQMKEGDKTAEVIDQQEGLLGAYQQLLKYCLHETEELTKPHKDEEGNIKLGKTAMYRIGDIGNAMHLLGASLGVYGFLDQEMEYYKEALCLKRLSVNGDITMSLSASDTLHSMGFSLDNAGRAAEALECYDQALGIRYACLGDDDLRVAETQHNKGALLCEEDSAEEAMECLEEALRIREIHYGEEHESCADTMQWMGNLLRKHGDPSDALDYFKFALSIKQKRLGSNHIDVANTLFNTAVLLDDIEKYELSLVAYKEALRIRKLVLGERNQEVADTLFCIGNVAAVGENHEEALDFYSESIKIREILLHDESFAEELDDCLFISNPPLPGPGLLSQYEKLSQGYEEALPLAKLILGANHPDVRNLLNRMGVVYKKLHDWDNAIGSFQGALRAKKADTPEGEEDLEVAALLQKKGEAYLYKHEFIRAKKTFDMAVQINKKILGADSMPVASSVYCLGVSYYYLSDYSHAMLLLQECMRIQVKLAGENNFSAVRTLCWIGRQHEKLKEPEKSLERYLSALQKCKNEKASIDYKVVAMILHAIGKLYDDEKISLHEMALKCYDEEITLINSKLNVEEVQVIRMLAGANNEPGMLLKRIGDMEKSVEHLEKALQLTQQCDGEESIKVAAISDNLGMLYASKKELSEAKKHYSSAYSIYEKSLGSEDLTTSDCAFRLGKVLEALESDLALDFFQESLRVHRLNMVEDDERVGEILFCSGRVFSKRQAHHDAMECFEEALGIRKRLLGDCSDVSDTYHNLGKSYSEMNQNEKALIFYRESVRINKKIDDKAALNRVSFDMAQCANLCSHFQLAIDCYNDCLQAAEPLDGNRGKDTAHVLEQMGTIQMHKLKNYSDSTKLFLDALEILRGAEDNDEIQRITILVLLTAQSYAYSEDYENSLDYYEEHIRLLESSPTKDVDLLANSLYEVGNIFATKGENPDFELAIEKFLECVEIKKKLLGADNEQVADVVYRLATVYEKAGNREKATESLAEALRSYELKKNKAGSVKVYHALARLNASKAFEMDSLPECSAAIEPAIECYKEALKLRRQIMSLDDIELAAMLYEYATLLCMNNEHETALPLLEEALRTQKSKNGLKDERVANILLRMAEVHIRQDKYDASLVSLEQVLFIHSALGGDCEIDLGTCHHLLGKTFLEREDFQKAIASYEECLEIKQTKFGCNSQECAEVHNDLGKAYGKAQNFEKGIQALVHALRIRKTELGNSSIEYGHSVLNLAGIHLAQSKHEQALNCLNETIRVYKLFPNKIKLAEVLEQKGDTLCKINEFESAVSIFQECLELLEMSDKNGHDRTHGSCTEYEEHSARLNHKIGKAFAKLGEYEEAFNFYREAVQIFSHVAGKNDLHVAEVMYDVGHLCMSQGGEDTCEKSFECFNEVIHIYGLHGKGKDRVVADSLVQKSTLLTDCSDFAEAASILDEAIDLYRKLEGNDSVEVGKAMLLYGRIHDAEGRNDKSMAAFDEALRIFQTWQGENGIDRKQHSDRNGKAYNISSGQPQKNAIETLVSLALQNIGIIHARKLEYKDAVEKCKMALKIRVTRGDQDQDVADSVFNIANIMNDWGEEDEAYQYFKQALKLYTLIGEDNISVANCQQKLGAILWNRREVDCSLESFLDGLRICKQEHEDDVTSILASIYRGIGDCYYSKEEYDQALEFFAKCLRIHKMEGDDCIEMAAPCDLIGRIYQKKEKYDEAMNFHLKSLQIVEKHHGKGSKECASSDFQLSKVLLASHKYGECIARLSNHLETYCKGLEEQEEAAAIYHPLGLAQSKVGKYEDSMVSLNKAVDIRTKLLGKTDLKVAETMLDLGKVLEDMRDSEAAIAVYDQAITILQKIPNSDFRAIASAYTRLGALFEQKNNWEASLHARKKGLKIYSMNCGSNSVVVGEAIFHIGKMYDQLGNVDKSINCFSEAVRILRSQLDDNEMIGQALGFIGKNYALNKQYAKAVELSTESLRLQRQYAAAGKIAESLVELGVILKAWDKADQAMQFFEEALRTYQEAYGEDAVEVATCRHHVGVINKQLGETEVALRHFGKALRVHRMIEGDKSLPVADNLFQIGQIYDTFENKEKSLKCFQECLKIRKDILGDDHLDVLAAQRYVKLAGKKKK